jgi:hypothetical protein
MLVTGFWLVVRRLLTSPRTLGISTGRHLYWREDILLGGSADVVALERENTAEDLQGGAGDIILEFLLWVGAGGVDLSLGRRCGGH